MNRLAVTYAEAGELLAGVSVRTVRRMVAAGELPIVRVHGRPTIPVAAIQAYIDRQARYVQTVAPCRTSEKIARTGGSPGLTAPASNLVDLVGRLTTGKRVA